MPAKRQNLMFSATFSKDIKQLAQGILRNPVMVEAEPENSTAEMVTQKAYQVDKNKKTEVVTNLIKNGNWNQVLIFMRTKHGANKLTKKLLQSGISAAAIHGNKSQGARTKALSNLDIPLLPHVINFELPNIPEDYVHRIGRTGRAGASGEAISLVCSEETEYQREIEKLLGKKLSTEIIEGYEPTDNAPPKRAATQTKGSFNKNTSGGNKSKRKPHFKGNKPSSPSGRGRTGAPKKKRY